MKIIIDMTESEQKNVLQTLGKLIECNMYLMDKHPEFRENIKTQTELVTKIISLIDMEATELTH